MSLSWGQSDSPDVDCGCKPAIEPLCQWTFSSPLAISVLLFCMSSITTSEEMHEAGVEQEDYGVWLLKQITRFCGFWIYLFLRSLNEVCFTLSKQDNYTHDRMGRGQLVSILMSIDISATQYGGYTSQHNIWTSWHNVKMVTSFYSVENVGSYFKCFKHKFWPYVAHCPFNTIDYMRVCNMFGYSLTP